MLVWFKNIMIMVAPLVFLEEHIIMLYLQPFQDHMQLGVLLNDSKLFKKAFKNYEKQLNTNEKMEVCRLKQEDGKFLGR